MNELEKKVLEHEERLLAIVSGNINIMSRLEKIEHDINKLKNDTENVLDILKQRDDELNDDMAKMKEYYLSLNYDIDRIISVMKKIIILKIISKMEKMNFNLTPTQGTTINYTVEVVENTNETEPLKIVPIADYNGEYWISNYGQVFSNKRGEMVELKPYLDSKGYYKVDLYKNGKVKRYLVHRLVNLHYNPNPRLLNVTDHINNNRLDNRASNLRWVTYSENSNNPNSNIVKPVARFTLDGEYIDEKPSIMSYEKEFGFSNQNINACLKGKTKSAYGYKFIYIDKDGYLKNF